MTLSLPLEGPQFAQLEENAYFVPCFFYEKKYFTQCFFNTVSAILHLIYLRFCENVNENVAKNSSPTTKNLFILPLVGI